MKIEVGKQFSKEDFERLNAKAERTREVLEQIDDNLKGRVLAVNFKKKTIIKSKCKKAKLQKVA